MARVEYPVRGIAVPDKRFDYAGIQTGNYDTGARWSEDGARPGESEPLSSLDTTQALFVGSGAATERSTSLQVQVQRAGSPSRARGPGVRVRYPGSGSGTWLGWSMPTTPRHLQHIQHNTLNAAEATAGGNMRRIPWTDTPCFATNGKFFRFDYTTWSWGAPVVVADVNNSSTVLALPGRRLLFLHERNEQVDAWYSDDDGDTWAPYATGVLAFEPDSISALGGLYHPPTGAIMLNVGGVDAGLYVSSDLGASFQRITDAPAAAPVAVGEDGTIYALGDEGGELTLHTSASPYVDWSGTKRGTIRPSVNPYQSLSIDADGTLWVALIAGGNINVAHSYDDGKTWTDSGLLAYENAATLAIIGAVSCRGSLVLGLQRQAQDELANASQFAMWLGGWATHEEVHKVTTAGDVGAQVIGSWDPGMEFVPSAGGVSVTYSNGYAEVDTTAATAILTEDYPNDGDAYQLDAVLESVSGGSLSNDGCAVRVQGANSTGTGQWTVSVRFDGTSVRVRDVVGGVQIGADRPAAGRVQVRIQVGTDPTYGCAVYVRDADDMNAAWELVATGALSVLATSGAQAAWEVVCAGTAVSRFGLVVARWSSNVSVTDADLFKGKRLSAQPYPIAYIGEPDAPYLIRALQGPAIVGERLILNNVYDYGSHRLFAVDNPLPTEGWRASELGEQLFEVDMGTPTIMGACPVLAFIDSNITEAYLEYYDGVAWQVAVDYDPTTDMRLFSYRRDGKSIEPDNHLFSTFSDSRWIHDGELVGDWFKSTTEAGQRITYNTGGTLNTDDTLKVQLRIEDGDSNTETGLATITKASAVAFRPTTGLTRWSQWRVRIASTVNGDTPPFAGACFVGWVEAIGMTPSHGWSERLQGNVRRTESSRGSVRKEERGPPRRVRTWSYQDPHDEGRYIRGDNPDWLGAGEDGDPMVAWQDVSSKLQSVYRYLESGAVPCVALMVDLNDYPFGTTLVDPEQWLYGFLEVESIQANNVQGDEGKDQVRRVERISMEEIK